MNCDVVGDVCREPLLQASKCLTTFSLTVFTQRNFVADFRQVKCNFRRKMAVMHFWAPIGRHRGRMLIEKRVVDFQLVLIELLSLGVMAEAIRAMIDWKSLFSLQHGPFGPKFQVEGVSHTVFVVTKLGWMVFHVWYKNVGTSCFRFVRQTDRRKDGQTADGQKGLHNTVRCITCSGTVKP